MLPKKLTCDDVKEIIKAVLYEGYTVASQAERFKVGASTVTNVLYRVSYKYCYNPLKDFASLEVYLDAVREKLYNNTVVKPGMVRKGS
jgi:hypothetical protein